MFVILLVAADTVFRCLLEHGTLMAILALCLGMFTQKRKAAFVMIKLRRLFPASLAMATSAVFAKRFFVLIVLFMTCQTVLT